MSAEYRASDSGPVATHSLVANNSTGSTSQQHQLNDLLRNNIFYEHLMQNYSGKRMTQHNETNIALLYNPSTSHAFEQAMNTSLPLQNMQVPRGLSLPNLENKGSLFIDDHATVKQEPNPTVDQHSETGQFLQRRPHQGCSPPNVDFPISTSMPFPFANPLASCAAPITFPPISSHEFIPSAMFSRYAFTSTSKFEQMSSLLSPTRASSTHSQSSPKVSEPLTTELQPNVFETQPGVSGTQPTVAATQPSVSGKQACVDANLPNVSVLHSRVSQAQASVSETQSGANVTPANSSGIQSNVSERQFNESQLQLRSTEREFSASEPRSNISEQNVDALTKESSITEAKPCPSEQRPGTSELEQSGSELEPETPEQLSVSEPQSSCSESQQNCSIATPSALLEIDNNGTIHVKKESDLLSFTQENKDNADDERSAACVNETIRREVDAWNQSSNNEIEMKVQVNEVNSATVHDKYSQERNTMICVLCEFESDDRSAYEQHVNVAHANTCFNCKFVAYDLDQLRDHSKTCAVVNGKAVSPPAKQKKSKKLVCKTCGNVAENEEEFYNHRRTHISEEKQLNCKFCYFLTQYKHHLDYHMKNHTGSKPFRCKQCDYSCVNKSMLNSHMKSHSNFYSYRCQDCSYEAKYMHALKCHCRKYSHRAQPVINPDGSINPFPIVDIYGTRRGPKIKRDSSGNPIYPAHYTAKIAMHSTNEASTPPLFSATPAATPAISPPNAFNFNHNALYRHQDTPPSHLPFPTFPDISMRFLAANNPLLQTPPSASRPSYLHSTQNTLNAGTRHFMDLVSSLSHSSTHNIVSPVENSFRCPNCDVDLNTEEQLKTHILVDHLFSKKNIQIMEMETPPRAPTVPSRRLEESVQSEALHKIILGQLRDPLSTISSLNSLLQNRVPSTNPTSPPSNDEQSVPVDDSPAPLDLTKDHTPPQQIIRRRLSESPVEVTPSSLTPPDTCSPPKKQRRSDFYSLPNRRLEDVSEEPVPELTEPAAQSANEMVRDTKQEETDIESKPEAKSVIMSPDAVLKCSYCKITFGVESMFNRHIAFHDLNNPLKCSFCKETFSDVNNFNDHCYSCKNHRISC
uniref:Protein hunchback-like n=1 Tax=Hirondellea gigas TaxID=1518452 RepID=A0A6A7FQ81_9CRUS